MNEYLLIVQVQHMHACTVHLMCEKGTILMKLLHLHNATCNTRCVLICKLKSHNLQLLQSKQVATIVSHALIRIASHLTTTSIEVGLTRTPYYWWLHLTLTSSFPIPSMTSSWHHTIRDINPTVSDITMTSVEHLNRLCRGVDKFVRVGGLGCCCVYMQIFSPQNTMYSNIIR